MTGLLLKVGHVRVSKGLHLTKKGLPGVPELVKEAVSWAGLETLGTWRSWMLSNQAANFQTSMGNSQAHPLLTTSWIFCSLADSACAFLWLCSHQAPTAQLQALPLQKIQTPEYYGWVRAAFFFLNIIFIFFLSTAEEMGLKNSSFSKWSKGIQFFLPSFLWDQTKPPKNTCKKTLLELLSMFHFDQNAKSHSYSTLKILFFFFPHVL